MQKGNNKKISAALYPAFAVRRTGMTNAANALPNPSLVTPQEPVLEGCNRGSSAGYSEGNRGFTLVELLVVVLIIGILAAVAVPQYNKAVEKSRLTQQIVTVRALYNALEVYRMENGQYPPTENGAAGGSYDISYFNNLLDIQIQTDSTIGYYPKMYISQGQISANWGIGGGPGNGILTCSAHPSSTTYEKNKNLCLSICTDKEWRTWNHGEYCII